MDFPSLWSSIVLQNLADALEVAESPFLSCDEFFVFLLRRLLFTLIMQEYRRPSGFACPWVPLLPVLSIGFNMFLFAQVISSSTSFSLIRLMRLVGAVVGALLPRVHIYLLVL